MVRGLRDVIKNFLISYVWVCVCFLLIHNLSIRMVDRNMYGVNILIVIKWVFFFYIFWSSSIKSLNFDFVYSLSTHLNMSSCRYYYISTLSSELFSVFLVLHIISCGTLYSNYILLLLPSLFDVCCILNISFNLAINYWRLQAERR